MTNALVGPGAYFERRRWLVVPNVSWGWGLSYEADVIAVGKTGWCHEVEIKVDRQDLVNDVKKKKWERGLGARIQKFWYAVPVELVDVALAVRPPGLDVLPGVISVGPPSSSGAFPKVSVVRVAAPRANSRRINDDERGELLRLAGLRYWDQRMTCSQYHMKES
jgi:hypothetical protein